MPLQNRSRRASRERHRQAFALRLAGETYASIAVALGYRGVSGARDAVERFLASTADEEEVERVRATELARVDLLHSRWWPLALGREVERNPVTGEIDVPAREPNAQAVQVIFSCMRARSRLLGLDREPTVDMEQELRRAARAEGLDEEEVLQDALRIIEEYRPRPRRLRFLRG